MGKGSAVEKGNAFTISTAGHLGPAGHRCVEGVSHVM